MDGECQKKILSLVDARIDGVFSDMANNTTGNKSLDSFRTGNLCLESMRFAAKILNKNGCFVSKFFMGDIFLEIKMETFYILRPNVTAKQGCMPLPRIGYVSDVLLICKTQIGNVPVGVAPLD